jgi:hypothetical protein
VPPPTRAKVKAKHKRALHNTSPSVSPSMTPKARREQRKALVRQMSREEQYRLAIRTYRKKGTLGAVAQALDVKRSTVERWMVEDPAFMEDMVDAHQQVIDDLEHRAVQHARDGDTDMLKFLLKANRAKFSTNQAGTPNGNKHNGTATDQHNQANGSASLAKQTFVVAGQVIEF